jgi:hypothetical protein
LKTKGVVKEKERKKGERGIQEPVLVERWLIKKIEKQKTKVGSQIPSFRNQLLLLSLVTNIFGKEGERRLGLPWY